MMSCLMKQWLEEKEDKGTEEDNSTADIIKARQDEEASNVRNPRARGTTASARRERTRARDKHPQVQPDIDDAEASDQSDSVRRTRIRGIHASDRRDKTRVRGRQTQCQPERDNHGLDMDDDHMYMDDDHLEPDHLEPMGGACKVGRGLTGRFLSAAESTSSESNKKVDDSWRVTDQVPGGPIDGSVIPSFLGHVASRMWDGELRDPLKCQSRLGAGNIVRSWYQNMTPGAKELVHRSDLSHLRTTMSHHIDAALISAFVERWQPDTNTFHMPFGEMTIMLHDVWHILRIPVEGHLLAVDGGSDVLQSHCMELMGLDKANLLVGKPAPWQNGGISISAIDSRCRKQTDDTQAMAWTLLLLGCTLFIDKSGTRVLPSPLEEISAGLEDLGEYSWGSATLAYLYRQLGEASRGDTKSIGGCLLLLQSWIYEYFPCFRPQRRRISPDCPRCTMWTSPAGRSSDEQLQLLHVYRGRLDELSAYDVHWQPYGPNQHTVCPRTKYSGWIQFRSFVEPYMPARVLRQLGFVQSIPPQIIRPGKDWRSWNCKPSYKVEVRLVHVYDTWHGFTAANKLSIEDLSPIRDDPTATGFGYEDWYDMYSHPQILSTVPKSFLPSYGNAVYWVPQASSMAREAITDLARYDPTLAQLREEKLKHFMEQWNLAL